MPQSSLQPQNTTLVKCSQRFLSDATAQHHHTLCSLKVISTSSFLKNSPLRNSQVSSLWFDHHKHHFSQSYDQESDPSSLLQAFSTTRGCFTSPVLLESWRVFDVFCKSLELYYRKRCASGLLVLLLLINVAAFVE